MLEEIVSKYAQSIVEIRGNHEIKRKTYSDAEFVAVAHYFRTVFIRELLSDRIIRKSLTARAIDEPSETFALKHLSTIIPACDIIPLRKAAVEECEGLTREQKEHLLVEYVNLMNGKEVEK